MEVTTQKNVALLALITASSLTFTAHAADEFSYTYKQPQTMKDGWATGHIKDSGVSLQPMKQLVEDLDKYPLNVHSVLVIKNDKLIFEEYFKGMDQRRGKSLGEVEFGPETLHDQRSVTKSFTSALMGIAIEKDLIKLDDKIFKFFPKDKDLNKGQKKDITIEHLLTMSSGLEWDEETYPYSDDRNSETAMDYSESSTRYVLEQKVVTKPGEKFEYCGGCTMLLAGAIQHVTGKKMDKWAEQVLFAPLGIDQYEWLQHDDGHPTAASGLRLTPRSMAKFGYLYANNGKWHGKQVLSKTWVDASTQFHAEVAPDAERQYGYQWWLEDAQDGDISFKVHVARGNGGQRIYVVPALKLIAVLTAGNYNNQKQSSASDVAFRDYILPAALNQPAK